MKISLLFFIATVVYSLCGAQITQPAAGNYTRCFTMERVQLYRSTHPGNSNNARQNTPSAQIITKAPGTQLAEGNQAIVYIPVVFHVVLNNPYLVTDASVKAQLNALNTDFAGINADSTNAVSFYGIRGHSSIIRFVMAATTPSGKPTNGIERIISTTGSNVNLDTDPIKRTSLGGADAWDTNSYLNIWVGNDLSGNGILGFAQFPGAGNAADDGVFCNYVSFGVSSCNAASFNKGRTIVHEVGHYFGLFHIWGDETACIGDDFRSLADANSTVILPAGLFNPAGQGNTATDIGDTPNQAGSTTNCPTGITTDACGATTGKMYQNYMDYTADACYSLFTKKQVERMEWILNNTRASLKTSLGGGLPASTIRLDAAPVQSINPGGIDVAGCSSVRYPAVLNCAGSINPKVRIVNNGTDTLYNITVGLLVNGLAQTPVNVVLPAAGLAMGATTVVSFTSLNAVAGTYALKFYTYNANGIGTDMVPANDTLNTTLTVFSGLALPLTEGFETLPFPTVNWTIINPNQNNTWARTAPGNKSGYAAFIDNYSTDYANQKDALRMPAINVSGADSIIISFDLAHKNTVGYSDTLKVNLSLDCGNNFATVYTKAGAALATAGTLDTAYILPIPADWKTQRIALDKSFIAAGKIIVEFQNIAGFGNNIFIDNINLYKVFKRDIQLVAVTQPPAYLCSTAATIPTVTIKNVGVDTVTAFKVAYRIDNGLPATTTITGIALAAGEQTSIPLSAFSASIGRHNLQAFSFDPVTTFGTGDMNGLNDSLTIPFSIVGSNIPLSLTEGFEATGFPPVNWAVVNQNDTASWQRSTAAAKTGTASMVINNLTASSANSIDQLISPVFTNSAAYDSVFVSFDMAYAPGLNSPASTLLPLDSLELQVTMDCGASYQSVWKKWGTDLQTVTNYNSGTEAFIPNSSNWKNINLYLSPFIHANNFQVSLVNRGNQQNNIWVDNLNIYSKTVPRALKEKGFLIYPNPFNNSFLIRNYRVPVDLLAVQILNATGQLIWDKRYSGNAYTEMPVDFSNQPRGIYFIKMIYTSKTVLQKIIKD